MTTKSTSKIGQITNQNVQIYKDESLSSFFVAGTKYNNQVYYINKQAIVDDRTYYLLSSDKNSGEIGWINSNDIEVLSHQKVDSKSKTFFIKGTGQAFNKPWGGSKNIVDSNLSNDIFSRFTVNLTEKVGSTTWYQGKLNGKTVWIEASNLTTAGAKSDTSLVGDLKNAAVIYDKIATGAKVIDSKPYTKSVFYIRSQVVFGGKTYYLISTKPSKTEGTIGWVPSTHMASWKNEIVDTKTKSFFISGTGKAYSQKWNVAEYEVSDLSKSIFTRFTVDLTEKVGSTTWYRGTLNGKTVWIQSNNVTSAGVKSDTSLVGDLKNNAVIYDKIATGAKVIDSKPYTDAVFYIRSQVVFAGKTYYLISTKPSKTEGTIGWVPSTHMASWKNEIVDTKTKSFFISGTGKAYSQKWNAPQYEVSDLSNLIFTRFTVNLTEKVGSTTWYRGTLNGKTVWIEASNVTTVGVKSDTSLVGDLLDDAVIYDKIASGAKVINSTSYINSVYYIRSQVVFGGETYYLISTKPSKTEGIVGWVSAKHIKVWKNEIVDTDTKTFFLVGTGKAYSHQRSASKYEVFNNLSNSIFARFTVNLTEKVGSTTYYRGTLGSKTVWIEASNVAPVSTKSNTSLLGQLKKGTTIYQTIAGGTPKYDATPYLNSVYYIKSQVVFGNETYYLISTEPSKTTGTIGWVPSKGITVYKHTSVDSKAKTFYIKGTSKAYSKPWGGSKDVVFGDLSIYKDATFEVNLTEKVGTKTWYRGVLDGKTVWIEASYLNKTIVKYTNYNLTLNEALAIQMKATPQTDKYRYSAAYISSQYLTVYNRGNTNVAGVKLRTSTKLDVTTNVYNTVTKGTSFIILNNNVTGDSYSGSKKWYKVKYDNKELYVHSSLVNVVGKVGIATADVNVRDSESTSSHVYGVLKKGSQITVTSAGKEWHQVSYGTWRSPTQSDVKYYLNPDNFVNDDVQKFQFLDLSASSGVSEDVLNKYLSTKGIFKGKGAAFIEAGKKYGVNELYLVSHALLETGNGSSQLATGVKYSGKTVYNMYGIAAYDSCPLECGSQKAYNEGWTTPEKAIIGGAEFIAKEYIKGGNTAGTTQNTLYKMRWNPEAMANSKTFKHQYATDIGWAYKQINSLYNLYNSLGIKYINMDIPVYKK